MIFLHSCFISHSIVFFVTLFGPIFIVFAFNFIIFILGVRVLVTQSRKKKVSVKSAIKTMVSIVGLMVIFGLTWLFGALTVREVSTVFQYLFVIFNGFQGFFFFVVICVIGKDGRNFWFYVITGSLCRKSKKFSTSGTSNLREKPGFPSHNPRYTAEQLLTGNNFNKREELKFNSQLQEKTEIKMDTIIPNQQATLGKIHVKGSLGLEEIGTGMESEIDMESQLDIERNAMIANEDEANIMQGEVNGDIKANVMYSKINGDIETDMGGEMNMQASVMQDRLNGHDTDPANVMGDGITRYDTISSFVQNEVNVFEQKLNEFEELQFAPLSEKGNENSTG